MSCLKCTKLLRRLENAVPALAWTFESCEDLGDGTCWPIISGEGFGVSLIVGVIDGVELHIDGHPDSGPDGMDCEETEDLRKLAKAARELYWRNKNEIYRARMDHASWQRVRCDVLKRDDFKCQRCDSCRSLDVHHLTYENFGHETAADCVTLCRACHKAVEGR